MADPKREAARRTGPALEAMYRFLLWLVPAVEKFPRSQKFLLGDRIQTSAREVLSCDVTGAKRTGKIAHDTPEPRPWQLSP